MNCTFKIILQITPVQNTFHKNTGQRLDHSSGHNTVNITLYQVKHSNEQLLFTFYQTATNRSVTFPRGNLQTACAVLIQWRWEKSLKSQTSDLQFVLQTHWRKKWILHQTTVLCSERTVALLFLEAEEKGLQCKGVLLPKWLENETGVLWSSTCLKTFPSQATV